MQNDKEIIEGMAKFLVLCMKELKIKTLPHIEWIKDSDFVNGRPTFGTYDMRHKTIAINISNRHPLDIMRTLAHELCHFKQDLDGELNSESGKTGSKHENQANAMAGIIMRKYNQTYPDMFNAKRTS